MNDKSLTTYIVAFCADNVATHQCVIDALKIYGNYCPIHNNCWAIQTDMDARSICVHLQTSLNNHGSVFVIRSGVEAAWLNTYGEKKFSMAKGESMKPKGTSKADSRQSSTLPSVIEEVKIKRGRVDFISIYEIKDSELDILEAGSPATLQLNFAIFLLSTAINTTGTLFTVDIESQTIKTVFIVLSIASWLFGIYLFLAWRRNKKLIKCVIANIRQRIERQSCTSAQDSKQKPKEK